MALFQLALYGEDISDVLIAELNTGRAEPIDLDTWWKEILESLVNSDYEVVETMTNSRLWLGEMAQFSDTTEINTEKYSLNLRSIWEYRANPAVRTLLSARRDILGLRMEKN